MLSKAKMRAKIQDLKIASKSEHKKATQKDPKKLTRDSTADLAEAEILEKVSDTSDESGH